MMSKLSKPLLFLMLACACLVAISTLRCHYLRRSFSSTSALPRRRRLANDSPLGWKFLKPDNDPRTIDRKDDNNFEAGISLPPIPLLRVCNRLAPIPHEIDAQITQKYSTCPLLNEPPEETKILLLEGVQTFGRTGNNLIEFLHSLQWAKDHDAVVGIVQGSWPTHLITPMWMAVQDDMDEWIDFVERSFCVKILDDEEDLDQYKNIIRRETRDLFVYQHHGLLNQYVEYQGHILRTLFRSYNHGVGFTMRHKPVGDMCSVLDAIFGDAKHSVIYSVIHSRSLEGEPGIRLLERIAKNSGCDPMAALDMEPEYVKAILGPLGMLQYPIVFITDHQRPEILEKLKADPDIGRNIHLIPAEASWVGGDITVALMSNVFIGNPASSFSGFIAKSRVALGYESNYLFRRKNKLGDWIDVCDHRCIFDNRVMNAMA